MGLVGTLIGVVIGVIALYDRNVRPLLLSDVILEPKVLTVDIGIQRRQVDLHLRWVRDGHAKRITYVEGGQLLCASSDGIEPRDESRDGDADYEVHRAIVHGRLEGRGFEIGDGLVADVDFGEWWLRPVARVDVTINKQTELW